MKKKKKLLEHNHTIHLRRDTSTDWQSKIEPLSANSNRFTLKGHWLTAHVSDTHLERVSLVTRDSELDWARLNQWNKRKIRDDYSWTTPIDKRWAGPHNPLQADNEHKEIEPCVLTWPGKKKPSYSLYLQHVNDQPISRMLLGWAHIARSWLC